MHITISRLDARVAKLHRTTIAKEKHRQDFAAWLKDDCAPRIRPSMEAREAKRRRARLMAL